jgi:hypothetical protein
MNEIDISHFRYRCVSEVDDDDDDYDECLAYQTIQCHISEACNLVTVALLT